MRKFFVVLAVLVVLAVTAYVAYDMGANHVIYNAIISSDIEGYTLEIDGNIHEYR